MMLESCIVLFQISAESLSTSKGELWISPCGLQLDKLLKNTWFGLNKYEEHSPIYDPENILTFLDYFFDPLKYYEEKLWT